MEGWVARNNGAAEFPGFGFPNQAGANRIAQIISTSFCERILSSLFGSQNMVVSLGLKFCWRKRGLQMCAQERHPNELVAVEAETHPDQVQMVRHQAVRGTEKALADGCVKHQ